MISMEVHVNSQLIGHVYARNIGYSATNTGYSVYDVKFYEPEGDLHDMKIEHKREDGWKVLMKKILYESIVRDMK